MKNLNDFYDLLNEEGIITYWQKPPVWPIIQTYQKIYTMGPGIDFPLVMNYSDTEMPNGAAYFYFLSGHNDVAYFSNSTFDDFETYEYNPWGVLLTQANKNNLLYTSREFDFDIALQFNRMRYYLLNLGRFSQKDLIYMKASNAFAYASDNPINFLDPFGLYNRGGMIPGISLGPGYGGGGGSYYCKKTTSSCKSPCMYCCIYDENGNLAGYVTTCQCDYLIYCDDHR
jgi:RHS repeat-associated protein